MFKGGIKMKNKYLFVAMALVFLGLTVSLASALPEVPMRINAQAGVGAQAGPAGVNASANGTYNGGAMRPVAVPYRGEGAFPGQARALELVRNLNRFELRFGNYSINCTGCNLSLRDMNQTELRDMNRTRLMNETGYLNGTFNGTQQRIMATLSNGKNAEIKVMPDVASKVALERLRLKVCNETNNCSLQLRQVGNGTNAKLAYNVDARVNARVLGLFKTRANVATQVDAETGQVLSTKRPWWSFMASWKN